MKAHSTSAIRTQQSDNAEYNQEQRQLKRTRQKEAILRALSSTSSHPTVIWIYDKVRKDIPNISLGTVYRNLKILQEKGEISELELNGNASRFDARTDYHEHFRCEKCGQVFDINEPVNRKLNERLSRRTGFEISRYQLEFYGLCQGCKQS